MAVNHLLTRERKLPAERRSWRSTLSAKLETALRYTVVVVLLAALLEGCGEPLQATPSVEYMTQAAPALIQSLTRAPTATPVPSDTGWRMIAPGLEYRELRVSVDDRSDRLRIARIDPTSNTIARRLQPR